jgi:hypothetical protein
MGNPQTATVWASEGLEDIEKQPQRQVKKPRPSSTSESTELEQSRDRISALQSLFGYTRDQLQQIPTISSWCHHIENCFQPLLTDEYACLWDAIGCPRPKSGIECWPWFKAVAAALMRVEEADISIDELCEMARTSDPTVKPVPLSAAERSACLVATFAVLCWGSMTLQPKLLCAESQSSEPKLTVPSCLAVRGPGPQFAHQSVKMDFVHRPVPAVFRNFNKFMRASRGRQAINGPGESNTSTVLHVSTLNYSSLRVVGKISVRWVEDISSHLDFNSRTRTLSIFRFPSFSAVSTLVETRGVVFEE